MTKLDRRAAMLAGIAAGAVGAARPKSAQAQAGSGRLLILGAGATFPAPLYLAWIARLNQRNAAVQYSYDVVGSGEGVSRFVTGSVDFGASDAAMSDAQIARVERGVRMIPATAGMVVLAYNLPSLTAPLRLPRAVLPAIMAGEITRWNDPAIVAANPGQTMPSRTIATVARLDGSGTTFAFTNSLSAVSAAWKDRHGAATRIDWPRATMLMRGNEGVAGRIKQTENSIGYIEYGFAARLGLPMAILQNRSGAFVTPTPESGAAALLQTLADMPENLRMFIPDPTGADSYPIVTYSWLLLYARYPDAARREAVKGLVRFGLTEGQRSEDLTYLALPDPVAERSLAALETIS